MGSVQGHPARPEGRPTGTARTHARRRRRVASLGGLNDRATAPPEGGVPSAEYVSARCTARFIDEVHFELGCSIAARREPPGDPVLLSFQRPGAPKARPLTLSQRDRLIRLLVAARTAVPHKKRPPSL